MSSTDWHDRRLSRRTLLASAAAGAATLSTGPFVSRARAAADAYAAQRGPSTLNVGIPTDVIPASFFRLTSANNPVDSLLFNRLVEYDPATFKLRPALAQSWAFADHGETLKLTLRKGVKFHSGRPFGAKDVLFALSTIKDKTYGSQATPFLPALVDAASSGANQLTLRFSHRLNNAFDIFQLMPIVDQESFSDLLTGSHVIGTGPYVWGSRTPGVSLGLSRNPHYWKAGSPHIQNVSMRVIGQPQALVAALRSGQIHLALGLSPLDLISLRGSRDTTVTRALSADNLYYVGANVSVDPLGDPQVRHAIAYAIDRERVLQQVFNGAGAATSIWWAKGTPGYSASQDAHYAFNQAKAKTLVQAAGAKGAKIPIAINANLPIMKSILDIVQFNLQQIGLDPQPVLYPGAQFVQHNQGHTMPGLWINNIGLNLHPESMVLGTAPLNPNGNTSRFGSKEYASLANRVWTARQGTAQNKAINDLTSLMLDAAFNIPIVRSAQVAASTAKLKNLAFSRIDDLVLDNATLA